ncbi:MAG: hypothetical protein ACQEQR_01400 [Pseudomonadota bacterium]
MRYFEKWLLPPRCVLTGKVGEVTVLSTPVIQALERPSQVCPKVLEPSLWSVCVGLFTPTSCKDLIKIR